MTTPSSNLPASLDLLPRSENNDLVPAHLDRTPSQEPVWGSSNPERSFVASHWGLCTICSLPLDELQWWILAHTKANAEVLERAETTVHAVQQGYTTDLGPVNTGGAHELCILWAAVNQPTLHTGLQGLDTANWQVTVLGYEKTQIEVSIGGKTRFYILQPSQLVHLEGDEGLEKATARIAELLEEEKDPDEALAGSPEVAQQWKLLNSMQAVEDDTALGQALKDLVFEAAEKGWYGIGHKSPVRKRRAGLVRSAAEEEKHLRAEAAELDKQGAFEGKSKNQPCPCGSGKRIKACHGPWR